MKKIGKLNWMLAIVVGSLLFVYQNCAYVAEPTEALSSNLNGTAGASSLTPEEARALGLQKGALGILKKRCASCHSPENPKGDIDFITDVEALEYFRLALPGEAQISPLYTIMAKGEMPPSGPLPQEETQLIYDWIAEGMTVEVAPTTPGPTQPGNTLEPKFSSIFPRIIQPNCVRCHRAGGVSFDLASYNAVMNIVQRNVPNSSSLFTSINTGRMPKGSAKLADTEISAIRDWITAGALNN